MLYKLHLKHHSVPATSTAMERCFSAAGYIASARRSSLSDDMLEAMLIPQVASQLSAGQSSVACDADGFTTVTHKWRRPSGSAASNSKTSEDNTV